jgi:eukaryotic-like serine/threonine-protein kinase
VVAGVRAAHEAGVVHRDLKPSNIFLARRGRTRREAVVLDFGVSRVLLDDELGLTPVTASETMIGTAAYIAPEQAKHSRMANARSDQYSLGVILYECATGARPFAGQSTYELLHSIATATVRPPSQLNPALPVAFDELVLRALSRDPEQRFEDLDAFARALMAFAAPRTWMAWGRELVAADWADDDCPTSPPSGSLPVAKSMSLAIRPAAPARRRVALPIAFAVGATLSAVATALVRSPIRVEAASVQPPSQRLSEQQAAIALTSTSEPRSGGVAGGPPALSVSVVDPAASRKLESRMQNAPARLAPRVPASLRPRDRPATTDGREVELGQNDAPIIK